MASVALRIYLTFREPKVFLTIVCAFITTSLTAHVLASYDADLGLTNLILSIEASLYGVVSSMMVKSVSRKQDEMAEIQRAQLGAVLEMTQALRDMLADHMTRDERILKALTEGEVNGPEQ